MVDQLQRRRYARLLRALATGRLTNFEYEDAVDKTVDMKKDLAIDKIYGMAWSLYDDINEHRLRGEWALSPEARHSVATWLLFLYSDLEFSMAKINEPDVWPFPNKQTCDDCKSKPVRYFCGEESLPTGTAPFKSGRLRPDEDFEPSRHRLVPVTIAMSVILIAVWWRTGFSMSQLPALLFFLISLGFVQIWTGSYKSLAGRHGRLVLAGIITWGILAAILLTLFPV